jgi:hypothetical protein
MTAAGIPAAGFTGMLRVSWVVEPPLRPGAAAAGPRER